MELDPSNKEEGKPEPSRQEPDRKSQGAYVPRPDLAPAPKKHAKPWAIVAAALVLSAGALKFFLSPPIQPPVSPPPAVVDIKHEKVFPVAMADLDKAKTEAAVAKLKAGQVPDELKGAPQAIREAVRDGKMGLFTVRLLDWAYDDGDIVDVKIDGQSIGQLTISNAGNVLTIPLTPGRQQSFGVTAVFDGGGGVTFGAQSSAGEMVTRSMGVGESETWNITFR